MKFLCEQCKAKYQIADEKAAGKTVRMKCRKCGYLIEVRAEVRDTRGEPTAPAAAGDPMSTPGPNPASEAPSLRTRPAQKPAIAPPRP
ncbi:MAG: zinc-ribbon domain-containing protein, partial [Myxococcota bacterium]|nr:zinc-ribbon domain-containing protein [Myxococcota bacterium]